MTASEPTPPDLAIKGLSLWATGRPYPNATDTWDADLIDCRMIVEARRARVDLDGVIGSRDFHWFLTSLVPLYDTLAGEASLKGTDMDFDVSIKAATLGHMSISIMLTPDYTQKHEFAFDCDQTELRPIIAQCRAILERFPVRIKLPD